MIVVDTSVLVAILKKENDAETLAMTMLDRRDLVIGAPTKFELLLVTGRWMGEDGVIDAKELIDQLGIRVLDWTDSLSNEAASAFLRYGKNRHSAALNFGDCMAYALAKSLDAPLLYKGDDFAQTDIKAAL